MSKLKKKDEKFLSRIFGSKKEFDNDYKQLYSETERAKQLYVTLTRFLKKAVENNDPNLLKKYELILGYIHEFENHVNLLEFYKDSANVIRDTNLVILSCLLGKEDVLYVLFDVTNNIFKCLSQVSEPLRARGKDKFEHTAFYYAIRSGNVKLLKILINCWPDDYFNTNKEELDEILSTSLKELRLRNIPLIYEMKIFIEKTILDIRFFSNNDNLNRSNTKDDSFVSRKMKVKLKGQLITTSCLKLLL